MGRRYDQILQKMGVSFRSADAEFDGDVDGITKVIIATPTATHRHYIEFFNERKIEILCEKPVVKSVDEICALEKLVRVPFRWVCNWRFVYPSGIYYSDTCAIDYHNSRTGDDGLAWDCIQLIYLANNFHIKLDNKADSFRCTIDDFQVSLEDIEVSYERMIGYWISKPIMLWDMTDAVLATCKVQKYIEEALHGSPDSSAQR